MAHRFRINAYFYICVIVWRLSLGPFNRTAGSPYALSMNMAINLTAGGEINYSSHITVAGPATPPPVNARISIAPASS